MKNNYHPIRRLIGLIILAALYNLGVCLFFNMDLAEKWTSFSKVVLLLSVFALWLIAALYSIYQSVFSRRARNLFKFSSFLLILNGLCSLYTFIFYLKEQLQTEFLQTWKGEWIFLIPVFIAGLDILLWFIYKRRQKAAVQLKKPIKAGGKKIRTGPIFFCIILLITVLVLLLSLYQVYDQSKATSSFFKECSLDFNGYNKEGYAAIVCQPQTKAYQSVELECKNNHHLSNGKKEKITIQYVTPEKQRKSMSVNIKVSGLKEWYENYSSIPAEKRRELKTELEANLDAVLSPGSHKDYLAGFYAPDPYLGGNLYSLYKETDTMNNTSYKIVYASKIAPDQEFEIQILDWYIPNSNDGAFITDFMQNFNENNKLEAIE